MSWKLSRDSRDRRPAQTTLSRDSRCTARGTPVDFFSLDVEGYEIPVLQGMNPDRHRPRFILVETKDLDEGVLAALKGHYRQNRPAQLFTIICSRPIVPK